MSHPPRQKLRVCLAASGGGHLRQLLDLQPVWGKYDSFFVTEPTALGESLAAIQRTYFVTHFAAGQARLGRPWIMIKAAWGNLWQARRIISAERPDVVISTGAGAVFFVVLFAKLMGSKIVLIESFARFRGPSLFMRVAANLADEKILQSRQLAAYWRNAEVFDPLLVTRPPRKAKDSLLFATVGATLPFERLVSSVAELKREGAIPEHVIAQVGKGGYKPSGVEAVESLSFDEVQSLLKRADIVVCHGGTGSIITALREQCRVIVMPRIHALGEHYDDHQEEITAAFVERGLVSAASTVDELRSALLEVRQRDPVRATTDPKALRTWLDRKLRAWAGILSRA